MTLAVLSGMLLAVAGSAMTNDTIHSATVQRGDQSLSAVYHVTTRIRTRDVQPIPVNRPGLIGCRWTAEVGVQRQVSVAGAAPVAALARPVGTPQKISGFQHGMCAGVRDLIEKDVAARVAKIEQRLVGTARQDHPALLTEIDSVDMLAVAKAG